MRIPFKRIDRNKKNINKKKHLKNKEEAEGKRDSQKWMKNNNYQFFLKKTIAIYCTTSGAKLRPTLNSLKRIDRNKKNTYKKKH